MSTFTQKTNITRQKVPEFFLWIRSDLIWATISSEIITPNDNGLLVVFSHHKVLETLVFQLNLHVNRLDWTWAPGWAAKINLLSGTPIYQWDGPYCSDPCPTPKPLQPLRILSSMCGRACHTTPTVNSFDAKYWRWVFSILMTGTVSENHWPERKHST